MTEELEQLMKNLKLRRMLAVYDEQLQSAEKAQIPYTEFVAGLLRAQWHERQESALEWRIHRANLPERWSLETFPWSRQPGVNRKQMRTFADLDFVAKHENLVLVGPTGVGKTGLACGLLLKALQNGHRCQFVRAQDLFDEMYAALADRSTRQLLNRLARLDVLLIDLCEVVSNVEWLAGRPAFIEVGLVPLHINSVASDWSPSGGLYQLNEVNDATDPSSKGTQKVLRTATPGLGRRGL